MGGHSQDGRVPRSSVLQSVAELAQKRKVYHMSVCDTASMTSDDSVDLSCLPCVPIMQHAEAVGLSKILSSSPLAVLPHWLCPRPPEHLRILLAVHLILLAVPHLVLAVHPILLAVQYPASLRATHRSHNSTSAGWTTTWLHAKGWNPPSTSRSATSTTSHNSHRTQSTAGHPRGGTRDLLVGHEPCTGLLFPHGTSGQ